MKKLQLWKIAVKYRKSLMLGILAIVVAISLDMIYPQLTRIIVDDVIIGGNGDKLNLLLLGILGVGLGRAVCQYIREYNFDMAGCRVSADARKGLFKEVQKLSMDYFDEANTGELMARIMDDCDRLWDAFGMTGMFLIEVTLTVGMVLYCMFKTNVKLTFLPLSVMVIFGILAVYMEKRMDKIFGDISEKNAELTSVAEENISGVRTVKAFVREAFEIEKFCKKNDEYYDLNMKQAREMAGIYPYFRFAGTLLPVATAILGGIMVSNHELSLGSLVAFIAYSRNIVWPMEIFGELANEISEIAASYKKINKVLAHEPTIVNPDKPHMMEEIKGDITFNHVGFTRDDHEILKDITFHLPAGQTLGIMGETGSGKSSIINLIGRLFDVTEGSVMIDGVDVRRMDLKQLRESIAPVMQDVFLFSDSIEENIRMGSKENITRNQVMDAAKKAQADGFISDMEEGYETIIGERGVGLSGGQKQRISIARALSRKSPILIFDDATSALDMETEREIQKVLNACTGKTKIIVGHRISAVRHANQIIVMENGRIAERGNHEELLAKKGLYYETYKSQYGDYMEVV